MKTKQGRNVHKKLYLFTGEPMDYAMYKNRRMPITTVGKIVVPYQLMEYTMAIVNEMKEVQNGN